MKEGIAYYTFCASIELNNEVENDWFLGHEKRIDEVDSILSNPVSV